MRWQPTSPVCSTIGERKPVEDWGTDLKIPLEWGKDDLKTVSGVDNFQQHVRTRALTPKSDQFPWGTDHAIFEAATEAVFQQEAERLANQLASDSIYDSLTKQQVGVGHTIEVIEAMAMSSKCLDITMRCTGWPDLITISIDRSAEHQG